MKKILSLIICSILFFNCFAQESVDALRENARSLLQQGSYDNALQLLQKAHDLQPDNLDVLKDEIFTYYYKRDFAKALEIGKTITEREDADVQSYQLLGMTYKEIAKYKDAANMYKTALKKFPNSGVLHSEYGDLLSLTGDKSEAIKEWEKGIEIDPNISSNYYYAVKYYAKNGNIIWALLYGEIFINIESLTKRTSEIKDLLLNGYKKLFENSSNISNLKNGNSFENAVAATFNKVSDVMKDRSTPEAITALRTRFILDWYPQNAQTFSFRLFDFQRQLLQEGYFSAYNQWIFGEASGKDKFNNWVNTHDQEMQAFSQFQRSYLFKLSPGQYYEH